MIRDSSPPLAILRSGWASWPGLVWATNSMASNPLGVAGSARGPASPPSRGPLARRPRAAGSDAYRSIASGLRHRAGRGRQGDAEFRLLHAQVANCFSIIGPIFFATAWRLAVSSSPRRLSSARRGWI